MNKEINVPDWAWDFYQAKQGEALGCPNDATEETLNYLVRIFDAGAVPETEARLKQMTDNHLAGERQKSRRRVRILENIAATCGSAERISADRTASSDLLSVIQTNVSPSQWRLLLDLAEGASYKHLSGVRKSSLGTVKSSVCRLRQRLRKLVQEDEPICMAV